ncbi:hypothetical protein MNBD_GAMMA10-1837, partial [hydrothermal vent metagenome]
VSKPLGTGVVTNEQAAKEYDLLYKLPAAHAVLILNV